MLRSGILPPSLHDAPPKPPTPALPRCLMFRKLLLAVAIVSVPAFITGCGSKDPNTAEEANSDKPPQEELKAIADDLNKDIDAIIKPINDVDAIVKDLD